MTRKHLEPSVAVRLHHGLGLPSSAINFDVANACLGFINGMSLAAGMIQSGQVKYALIVNGEDADEIQVNTINRLVREDLDRDAFAEALRTLVLTGRVWIIATLRADFFSRTGDLPERFRELFIERDGTDGEEIMLSPAPQVRMPSPAGPSSGAVSAASTGPTQPNMSLAAV